MSKKKEQLENIGADWSTWVRLMNRASFLYDEDLITLKTYNSMTDDLCNLKHLVDK